jgi:hypothetical protein
MRESAKLTPSGGSGADDIIFIGSDSPSIFAQPLCPNTWRNGQKIGDEPAAPSPGGPSSKSD